MPPLPSVALRYRAPSGAPHGAVVRLDFAWLTALGATFFPVFTSYLRVSRLPFPSESVQSVVGARVVVRLKCGRAQGSPHIVPVPRNPLAPSKRITYNPLDFNSRPES